MANLTTKQRLYTEFVAGGMPETDAALKAGYSKNTLNQLLYKFRRDERILDRIEALKKADKKSRIKTPEELQQFWSDNIDDPGVTMVTKTEQSKLLARSLSMFVDHKKVEANVNHKAVMMVPEVKNNEEWDKFWEANYGE